MARKKCEHAYAGRRCIRDAHDGHQHVWGEVPVIVKRKDTGGVFPEGARKLAAAIVVAAKTTCLVPMTKLEAAEWFAKRAKTKCAKCNRVLPEHDCRWV